jgi:hypothetical protein
VSVRTLRRILIGYAGALLVICVAVRQWFVLSAPAVPVVVESTWKDGKRVGRQVRRTTDPPVRTAQPADVTLVSETVVGSAPLSIHPLLFTIGVVPGRDGVEARLGDRVAYATVDDLMGRQAYDRAHLWVEASFGWGTHIPTVLAILSEQLGVPPDEVRERATFSRVRFVRHTEQRATAAVVPERPDSAGGLPTPHPREWPEVIREADLTPELVRDGLAEAATYLARNVDGQGYFRYMVEAPTNRALGGYNWPRHSGATFFLAQAAHVLNDGYVQFAALRAAARLRLQTLRDCGPNKCIVADEAVTEIGSSALALIAFTELVRTGADRSYRPAIADLAAFLRSQQRPDGELMHLYDRARKTPVDVQFLYFTGEAALALARAHAITNDPRDLDASRRALARLAGGGWRFFGSRYYFGEEHWTCQAVAELWSRAPDPEALAFCSRWHEYQRRLQQGADETPFDSEGSFGFGPLVSPRITPASSRGEAAGALAEVLYEQRAAGEIGHADEIELVRHELGRALAFVLRSQFHPGPNHLFADPRAVRGAIPGSPVDWQLRIDYPQHAGSMMIRWLEVEERSRSRSQR